MNQKSVNRLNFKLCILGDGGVGKTTMIHRYLSGRYLGNTKMTIGVDFHIYKRNHGDKSISFQIWDLSGQEHFQRMRVFDRYVQGSHIVMLAVDLSRIDTFENLPTWLEVAKNANTQPLLILVGTKKDLEREIEKEFLEKWACEQGFAHIIETSSLTGENVNELFELISMELIERWENSCTSEMVTMP